MSFDINLKINLFTLSKDKKSSFFRERLFYLNKHHIYNSKVYKNIIQFFFKRFSKKDHIHDFPFIPIRLFKLLELKSINKKNIYKILKSSGTGGKNLSTIFLDKKNSKDQVFVLSQIVSNFIGKKRLPMLIIDSEETIKNTKTFSARAAAIYGFTIFGINPCFALNNDMTINQKKVSKFLLKHNKDKFIIFGFTSIIWKNFLESFINKKKYINMSNGILLHGGGWKKLSSKGISNNKFKKYIYKYTKINEVINYYGMVEQTGSVFFECKFGYFHTSEYSEVLIRDKNFKICKNKKTGLIQLLSVVPTSYPGNSILTEDLGEIVGEDNCKCGRKGKYFLVHGRIKDAELRGCSDVNK